ncbi:MAG: hypothetical protein PHC68_01310 [Syntrophorhabdaceae bacterium]|nr:hypothetical protein [Syntrophorhabdaceae bacterium]
MPKTQKQIIRNTHEDTKARSFLEAVGLIEQVSACEMDLPDGSYPTPSRLTFANVAIAHALQTTVLTFLLSPITMLVIDNYMHIFGRQEAGFLDNLFSVLLSCAPAAGFSLFFSIIICKLYLGKLTKSLLGYYITPYIMIKFIVTVFMFMILFIVSTSVLTEQNITFLSRQISGVASMLNENYGPAVYNWSFDTLHELQYVLIKSGVYSTCIHIGCAILIGAAYVRSYWRSWLIDMFSRDFD